MKIGDHTLGFNVKKSGKVTTSGRIVVSADGKSRTVTVRAEPIRPTRNSPAPQCTTSSELFLVLEKSADQMPFRSFSMAFESAADGAEQKGPAW